MAFSKTAAAAGLAMICTAALLSACAGAHPFIRAGDAKSVEIVYSDDVASAWPLARRHCGQFDKAPRLVSSGNDTADFDCVGR